MDSLRLVRLDTRGKAFFLGGAAVIIIIGVLVAKSFLFTDPSQQKISQTIESAREDLAAANAKLAEDPSSARQLLMRALSAITAPDIAQEKSARTLTASLVDAMDQLDNAQTGTLTLFAQPEAETDTVITAIWASASDTLWAVTHDNDDVRYIGRLSDGTLTARVALTSGEPSMLFPIESGVVILDTAARATTRILGTTTKTLPVTTQDTIVAGSMYEGSLYLLTDKTVLKVADLDTDKPVTKTWLADASDLVANAAQIYVDGSVWIFGRDGMLTEYYKGKQKRQLQTNITPSGSWKLFGGPQSDQLAIANSDTKRIYIIDMSDGTLIRTIKIDTEQPILHMLSGPADSTLIVTKDNKIWSVK